MPGSSLFLVYVNGCLQTTESITTLMIDSKNVHCASLAPRKPWIISCVARLLWRNKFTSNKSSTLDFPIGISLIVHCHLCPEHGLRSRWKSAARESLALEDVSSSRLDILTNAFWKANQTKPFISTRKPIESTGHSQGITFLQPPTSPRFT